MKQLPAIIGQIVFFLSLLSVLVYDCQTKDTTIVDRQRDEIDCFRQTENALQCCMGHSGMNEWACRNHVWSAEKITYEEYLIKRHNNVVGCRLHPAHKGNHEFED
jgi:hypothetical protein